MNTNRRHWCVLATGSLVTSGLSTSTAKFLLGEVASSNQRRLALWLSTFGKISRSPAGELHCRAARRPGPWLARLFSGQDEAPFDRLRVTGGNRYRCDFAGGEEIDFALEFTDRQALG